MVPRRSHDTIISPTITNSHLLLVSNLYSCSRIDLRWRLQRPVRPHVLHGELQQSDRRIARLSACQLVRPVSQNQRQPPPRCSHPRAADGRRVEALRDEFRLVKHRHHRHLLMTVNCEIAAPLPRPARISAATSSIGHRLELEWLASRPRRRRNDHLTSIDLLC
jgi:hypothetical protein